jgi:polysaccharide pyruvyl transferase WcaK-like protein
MKSGPRGHRPSVPAREGNPPDRPAPRVGLFGLLGAGNIGNDASMQAVLDYLRADHPDAIVDAMCPGPDRLRREYGIEGTALHWHHPLEQRAPGPLAAALKVLGKGVDAVRTASRVRRHDVIIVPGMGVLEASLPIRPWETPYAMFLLSASGKLFGTKVALVSVGANLISQRATRWLFDMSARLAYYRSYRDERSKEAMRQRGLDVSADPVYPDLVFALPAPPYDPGDPQLVGMGVMEYYGTNDDRDQADGVHASYVRSMQAFARWLVDGGRRIRLLVGDTCDASMVDEIITDLRAYRPDLGPDWVVAEPVTSYADLTRGMYGAGAVVATRFHNVMCALKLGKPTISLGYAPKNISLMEDMGQAEFIQSANALDVGRLIEQFTEAERRSAQLRAVMAERAAANAQLLDQQFARLSELLFSGGAAPLRRPAVSSPSGTTAAGER